MYSSIFVNFLIYVHICSSQMVFLSNSSFVHYTASFFLHSSLSRKVCSKKIGRIFFPHFSGEYLFATLPITAPRQPIKITYAFWTSIFMFLTDLLQQSSSANCVGHTFRAYTTYSYPFAAYSLCENKLLIGFTWSHLF